MQDNKISINLTTVIIIAVIIGILLGIASYAVYNNFKQNTEESSNDKIAQSVVNSSPTIKTDNNSDNTIFTNNSNTSNTASADKEDFSNSSVTNSTTGKSSSKQNPLPIGEWGIASKYISGEYIDVPVKVTNVNRGSTAAQEVKNYCENGSSIYKYEDAKESMEWAVIEYSVDLSKLEKDSSVRMDTKITGTGDNTSIKYNGFTYIVSTMNMTSGYSKGEIVSCKFAVQLPIGCTDYLIALGSSSSTQAFFTGK